MNYAIQAAQNYSKRKNRKDNDSTQKGAAVSEQERQEAVTRLQNGVEQRTQILQPATRYATARQVYRKTGEELANSQYDNTYNELKLYISGKKTDDEMKSKYGFDDIDLNYYKTNWDQISADRKKSKLTQKALDMSDDDYKELSQAYSYQNPDNPVIGAIQKLFNNDPTAKVKDKLNLDDDDMDFYMNNWKSVENARKNNEERTAKDEYEEKWNSKSDDIKDKIRAYEKESDNIAEYNQTGVQPGYTYNSPSIGGTPVIAGTNITKNDKKEELRQQLLDSGLTEDDLKYYDKNFGTIEDMEKTNAAVERQEEALKNLQETDRELFDEYDKAQALMETPSFGSNAGYNVQTSYATEKIAKAKEKLEKAGWDTQSKEFQQMLEYVSRDNNRKETEQLQDTIKNDSKTLGGRIGWNAADLITHPVSGIAAAVETVKSNFYQDKDLPVDTNSPYYAATNIGQTTEDETTQYLYDKYGTIAGQAYGVGMSSAKSLESMAIGGAMSKALGLTGKSAEVASALATDSQFGLSSTAQGIKQAQDSGMGRQRAVEYGIAQGIAEAMFEHLSAENAIGMFSKASKGEVKSIIGEMAKSFMYEGSEEAFTDIANYISDRTINGDFSDYDLKMNGYMKSGLSENEARFKVLNGYASDVAQDFAAGGLSGVLIGGGTMLAGKINYRSAAKAAVSNENLTQTIEKTALEMPEESTARKIVEAKQADKLSTKEMAKILESMTEYSSDNDLQNVLEQEFVKAGNDAKTAKKNAQLIYDMATESPESVSEEDNEERLSKFSQDDSLPEVYGRLLQGNIEKARTVTDVHETLYNTQAEQEVQRTLKNLDRKNGSTVARATINDTPVIVAKVKDTNKSTVMLSNGQNVSLESVHFDNADTQKLYNAAVTFDSPEAANAFIEEYKGGSISQYALSSMQFYNQGKLGATSFDKLINNTKNANIVSAIDTSSLKMMYELGLNDAKAENIVRNSMRKEAVDVDMANEANVYDDRLEQRDEGLYRLADVLSRTDGVSTTLTDNTIDNNARGQFTKAMGMVTITTNSNNPVEAMLHEHIGEFTSSYNKDGWNKVVDEVIDFVNSEEGMHWVNHKINNVYKQAYKKIDNKITTHDAAEEFVNDVVAKMFTTEEGITQLVDHAQKNLSAKDKKTFIESVKGFFNDLIGKIKDLIKDAGSNIERQKFLESKERCEQIRDNVLKAWDTAIENRQRQVESVDSKEKNGKLSNKFFSLQFDEDGRQYIKIDEDILKGVNDKDVIKTVRNYIKENFPEGFEVAGYNVKNIGKGRKEFTSSKDSRWLKNNKPMLYLDKMRLARNIDEIISNVKNYKYEQIFHERKDNIKGFLRGNIFVEVGSRRYTADVVLGDSVENGLIMYDVVDMKDVNKKETGLNPAANDSAVAVPEPRPVSKINVTSEHKNVNTSNDRYSLNLSDKGQRYSANIDESLFEALDEIWALDEQKQAAGIVQKGFESLQNVQINDKIINKVAKNIIKEYGSTYDVSDLQHNLKNIFAYLKDTQNVSFEDMTKVMQEVAKPVLEQSTQIDESQKQDYEEFKGYLSKYKIKLNKSQREAVEYTYDNYNDFRKSMFGTLTLSNNGTYLDDIWSDIVEHSGYRLSYDTNDSDQIIELVDLMESMKPQRVNKYGMNIDNAAYDVALDIYRQFFVEQAAEEANSKVSSKVAELKEKQEEIRKKYARKYMEAVKKERLKTEEMQKVSILRLQDELYRLDAGEREAIKESDLINAAVLKAEKEKAQNQIKRIRNQKNEKIADIRARNFASRTNAARQRKATYLKGQIKKRMNELNSMLTHPTEAKHIPVEMVRGVVDVCKAVNLDNGNSQLMKEKMDKLKKYYDAYKKDESFSFDYDENISAKIGRLSEIFNGRHYMQLNNDELQEVYNIVSAVKQQISNANKLIANKKVQEVHEAAKMAVSELEAGKGINNKIQEISHKYATLHLNARREFRKLSGYEDDSVMMSMYNQLEDGQKKQLEVERHVCEVYEDLMDDRKNMKKLVSTKDSELVDVGLKDEEGDPVKVTKAMRLSIIMHSYNKSNMYHILNDGFTVPDLKLYEAGKIEEAWKKAKTYRYLSYDLVLDALKSGNHELLDNESEKFEKSIKNLEKDLSQFEKEFLKASKEIFHKYFGDEINKVSLATRGYEVARVKNYFPIRTDQNFTKTEWGNLVKNGTVEGSGFLKERVRSKNPILLEDITQVLSRQTASTARYVAYAVPIRNWNMLMNSTFHDKNGNLKSVKNSLSRHWGKTDVKYLENIIDDLQGGRHTSSTIADRLRSSFAGSTLSRNIGVAMKQAASYPTAAAVVGYRPLMIAMKDMGKGFLTQNGIEELEKRNPYLWKRTEDSSRSRVADVTENSRLKRKIQDKLDWITAMDVGTVRTLEYAAKYYVEIHNKELEKGSKEFWDKVSDVFTKIVTETQPNYTKLHQADIIRNPNALSKQLFMFKTQSLQNFGIMYDACGEYIAKLQKYKLNKNAQTKAELKNAKANLAHAISSQVVAAAVLSGMTILSKVFYHKLAAFKDDDGEFSNEKIGKFFIAGMIDTFAGCLLMGQEIYEEISAIIMGDKYYGMQVPIVELVNNTANDILKIQKAAENLKNAKTDEQHDEAAYNLKKYLVKLVESLCQFTGNPVQNDHNLLNGIYKWYGDTDADIIYGSADIKSQYDRIADAYLNGDMKEFDRLLEQQESILQNPDNAINGVTKKMKERYSAGELSEEEFKDYLVNGAGKDDTKAQKTISDIEWKEERGDDTQKMDVLVESYFSDKSEYKKVRNDIGSYMEDDTINSQMSKKVKEWYLSGKISAKQAKSFLKDIKEMSDVDSNDKLDEWKYSQTKEGKSGRAYSKYNALQDSISKSIKNPAAGRKDILNQIDALRNKGIEDKKIKSAITSDFKDVYLSSKNKADIQNVLLTAYMYLGDSQSEAMKKIQNWEKKAAEKSK